MCVWILIHMYRTITVVILLYSLSIELFIEVKEMDNVLVSGIQQSASVTYMCIYILFHILFHYSLLYLI